MQDAVVFLVKKLKFVFSFNQDYKLETMKKLWNWLFILRRSTLTKATKAWLNYMTTWQAYMML